jgi:hypothetical protein
MLLAPSGRDVVGLHAGALSLPVGGAVDDELVGVGGQPVDGRLGEQRVGHRGEPFPRQLPVGGDDVIAWYQRHG